MLCKQWYNQAAQPQIVTCSLRKSLEESLLILIMFYQISILLRSSNLILLYYKTYNFEDIMLFPLISTFNLTKGV